jgi:hypothetical protein
MISDRQWFTAKNNQQPPFTASVRRQERHYGRPVEVRRGWFRRNLGYMIFLLSGFGAVLCFAAVLLLTFHLLPNAIEAEMERQLTVVQEQIKGGK